MCAWSEGICEGGNTFSFLKIILGNCSINPYSVESIFSLKKVNRKKNLYKLSWEGQCFMSTECDHYFVLKRLERCKLKCH